MKLYQIHCETGMYDDYDDDVIETWIDKNKAEKSKERLIEIAKNKYGDGYLECDCVCSNFYEECRYADQEHYWIEIIETMD
ncbi:hypothetical protein [Clostridium butyricum]|uniref:hypothetical protein n=1 Tax=Clostridium butyricum TaxID=1492 RepID=UPI00325BB72F